MKMKRNRAQCLTCMDIIESEHRHDFVSCKCRSEREHKVNEMLSKLCEIEGIKDDAPFEERHNFWESEKYQMLSDVLRKMYPHTGFFLDGGLDYQRVGGDLNKIKDLSEFETGNTKKTDSKR